MTTTKIPQKIKVHYFEIEQLMAKMIGKSEQFENDEIEDLENEFYEKFDINNEQFHKIVEYLMPYTVASKSEITEIMRIGFVDHTEGRYIVKAEIKMNDNDNN